VRALARRDRRRAACSCPLSMGIQSQIGRYTLHNDDCPALSGADAKHISHREPIERSTESTKIRPTAPSSSPSYASRARNANDRWPERLTLVHEADALAGRHPFIRWALDRNGTRMRVHVGGCSAGFGKLSCVRGDCRRLRVGNSQWSMLSAAETLARLKQVIEDDPLITRCDNTECQRCPDPIAGGPIP
jgi:hypothetical protein